MPTPRSLAAVLFIGWSVALVGCQAPTAVVGELLVGRWVGAPAPAAPADDTAADSGPDSASEATPVSADASGEPDAAVALDDLQTLAFTILIDFHADGTADMTRDGVEPLRAVWRVLSSDIGVTRIEIIASPADAENEAADTETSSVKRRFTLKMADTGDSFLLREEGVDQRYGWLRFQRAG